MASPVRLTTQEANLLLNAYRELGRINRPFLSDVVGLAAHMCSIAITSALRSHGWDVYFNTSTFEIELKEIS